MRRSLPRRDATLPREFFDREPQQVAQELVGKYLLRRTREGVAGGRLVEVEAYLGPDDPASHSYRGRTPRNAAMFGPPGHAYVYSIHARYCCNVVTQSRGIPTAILMRAIEPLWGFDLMRLRRGTDRLLDLTRGPARLCEALQVDRRLDHHDMTLGKSFWLAFDPDPDTHVEAHDIGQSVRIGVTSAHDAPLRYYLRESPFVSGPKKLNR